METKKLGFLIVGLSVVLGFILFGFMNSLNAKSTQLNCNPTQECQQISSVLGVSHIVVGFFSFIFALGFYLLFFNKNENEILGHYKQELESAKESMKQSVFDNKFETLMQAFNENEQKILRAIKEQEGITQSTLKYRTDLSKATISQVLTNFERKHLVYRKEKGKTFSVYLAKEF